MDDLNRSARNMALLTVVSRASGFVRIAVFASVFGRTYLSNTYQSSNMLPNLLFELFAAGALQAALVPSMVRLRGAAMASLEHREPGTRPVDEAVAGAVLGLVTALLATVGVAAAVAGPQLMGVLVGAVDSAEVREAEIELGALWLWFFMPQMVFYGANIVATSVLNARNSFVVPVAAPIANNVIVIGAYLLFAEVHEGPLSLDVTTLETWILAGGTTLGVVIFCAIPVAALARSGFRLRPNLAWGHPEVRSLLRDGAWAAVFLAFTQLLLFVVLRVSNRDPGGPVTFQFAFILFTLPHSLLAVPIMTTRFPALSRTADSGDWRDYANTLVEGLRAIVFLGLGATAVMVSVARPATALVAFGEAVSFSAEIANATIAFAPGVIGFGLFLYLTRARYAVGDARSPALINAGVVVVAGTIMLTVVSAFAADVLVSGLALTFAMAQVAGAVLLYFVARAELRSRGQAVMIGWPLVRNVVAAGTAAAIGFSVSEAIGYDDRWLALVASIAAAVVSLSVFLLVQFALGGPKPRQALESLGGHQGRSLRARGETGSSVSPRGDDG